MKNVLFVLLIALSSNAFAHRVLGRDSINAMNMMRSENVRNCLSELDNRYSGDFFIQRATLHEQGTNSMYHLFGGFIEGGDMVHGSAHVDVKIGLLPPMGPGYQCNVISEAD